MNCTPFVVSVAIHDYALNTSARYAPATAARRARAIHHNRPTSAIVLPDSICARHRLAVEPFAQRIGNMTNRQFFALMGIAATASCGLSLLIDHNRPTETPAIEARLIGKCNGKIMAAMEESAFPASGCDWIEPIRYEGDAMQ